MGWLSGKSKGATWHGHIVENEIDPHIDGWQREEIAKDVMRDAGVPESEVQRAANEHWRGGR